MTATLPAMALTRCECEWNADIARMLMDLLQPVVIIIGATTDSTSITLAATVPAKHGRRDLHLALNRLIVAQFIRPGRPWSTWDHHGTLWDGTTFRCTVTEVAA